MFSLFFKSGGHLSFAAVWTNLQDLMLGEISQTPRDKYLMISLTFEISDCETLGSRKKKTGYQGLEGEGKLAVSTKIQLGRKNRLWSSTVWNTHTHFQVLRQDLKAD